MMKHYLYPSLLSENPMPATQTNITSTVQLEFGMEKTVIQGIFCYLGMALMVPVVVHHVLSKLLY
jgi:hypothetical protein